MTITVTNYLNEDHHHHHHQLYVFAMNHVIESERKMALFGIMWLLRVRSSLRAQLLSDEQDDDGDQDDDDLQDLTGQVPVDRHNNDNASNCSFPLTDPNSQSSHVSVIQNVDSSYHSFCQVHGFVSHPEKGTLTSRINVSG